MSVPTAQRLADGELLCELLRQFYSQGWCSGTGGGISLRSEDCILIAPSGVAKERVQPSEIFELATDFSPRNAAVLEARGLKLSECAPLFQAIYEKTGAGAVIHSHSVQFVVAMNHPGVKDRLGWERVEMLKGIRGVSYPERHEVPIIPNTPRECQLLSSLCEALDSLPSKAQAVFVRDHGAYIWGRDAMEAKRHAEIYDWLCQYANAMHSLGLKDTV